MNLHLNELLLNLPTMKERHPTSTAAYKEMDLKTKEEVKALFKKEAPFEFGPFGKLSFPYFKMGAVDSLDLFGLDELILFSFYWANRDTYKKVIDIGANIGLHSLLLAKCGFEVECFEPDPIHFKKLQEVISNNRVAVKSHCAAVSNKTGETEFVRVLGNTTSSHIAGAKQPYGELETFKVALFDIKELMKRADLMKLDVEGHEAVIITSTIRKDWEKVDAILEVGTSENAAMIFSHLQKEGIFAFSQKRGWNRVKTIEDMPCSYKEGSLFITLKEKMPWGA